MAEPAQKESSFLLSALTRENPFQPLDKVRSWLRSRQSTPGYIVRKTPLEQLSGWCSWLAQTPLMQQIGGRPVEKEMPFFTKVGGIPVRGVIDLYAPDPALLVD